eukprot:COSAG02_NODE_12398_length_1552_cov_49.653820_1_plen_88_part_00
MYLSFSTFRGGGREVDSSNSHPFHSKINQFKRRPAGYCRILVFFSISVQTALENRTICVYLYHITHQEVDRSDCHPPVPVLVARLVA